ncbi:MAG: hypothetical protein ACKPKO_16615, partial [Candidatus Fonsibacter sp.]
FVRFVGIYNRLDYESWVAGLAIQAFRKLHDPFRHAGIDPVSTFPRFYAPGHLYKLLCHTFEEKALAQLKTLVDALDVNKDSTCNISKRRK